MRAQGDRLVSMIWILATGAVMGLAVLPFAPPIDPASWKYLAAAPVLHGAYQLLLVRAYAHGELALVYPVARGTGPMLVAVVSLAGGDVLGASDLAGVALVGGGIMGVAFANGLPTGH